LTKFRLVRDREGQQLAYVYFDDPRAAAKPLTRDEEIAANIAKLPKFCAKANSILSMVVTAAAHTRLPLADAVSDGKADGKHDRKGNWIHDTSSKFPLRITPEQGR
jgi:hypothetical protein